MTKIFTLPMTIQRWQQASVNVALMTTGLNALANSTSETTGKAISAAVDNDITRDTYMDFELYVTYGVAPSAGGYVEIALIPSLDATNYADGSATVDPDLQLWVGRFYLRAVTSAQRLHLRGILLPPLKFKVLLRNYAGQAMAASGNLLNGKTYNLEVT